MRVPFFLKSNSFIQYGNCLYNNWIVNVWANSHTTDGEKLAERAYFENKKNDIRHVCLTDLRVLSIYQDSIENISVESLSNQPDEWNAIEQDKWMFESISKPYTVTQVT
jgi:hypothetical protein